RRAAGGAEVPPLVVARLAGDGHGVGRKDRRAAEQRAVMLAAVHAVAEPDPEGLAHRHDAHGAADAAGGETVQPFLPQKASRAWWPILPHAALRAAAAVLKDRPPSAGARTRQFSLRRRLARRRSTSARWVVLGTRSAAWPRATAAAPRFSSCWCSSAASS